MSGKISRRKAISTAGKIAVGVVGAGVVAGVGGYFAGSSTAAPVTITKTAAAATVTETVRQTVTQTAFQTVTQTKEVPTAQKITMGLVLGGYIEGSTWDGRQIRAAERLKKFYPWFDFVYDEGVVLKGKDPISSAKDLITINKANIVFGSWEPVGIPAFHKIADEHPNVYFLDIVASDLSSRRNLLRVFVRQYQAMYLEGLVAGAITRNKKIGISVGPAAVQNFRRMAAFYLGIKDANPDATLYIKYVGEWFDPPKEREVSLALLDLGVDVLTHYTDSVEPLKVAQENKIWFIGKDTDIVGLYGWSNTDTVAVSFDTRWEVMFDRIIKEYLAGITNPDQLVFVGMNTHISMPPNNPFMPGLTTLPAVDLQNNNRVGLDAISPKAKPLIPDRILKLIERRRAQMLAGVWDPFYEHQLVSSGEGIEIPQLNLKVPPKGTVVKEAKELATDDFLLGKLNFMVDGIVLVK
ncbi:MAG: BMP family ABC transporter substrate-binding protein [Candidatus Caldarchaeum sp.]